MDRLIRDWVLSLFPPLKIPDKHERCGNCLGRGWFGRGGCGDARRMCLDCIGLGYRRITVMAEPWVATIAHEALQEQDGEKK